MVAVHPSRARAHRDALGVVAGGRADHAALELARRRGAIILL